MSRPRRLLGAASLVAATALALPVSAQAHGLGQREDLPIPSWLFAWGAAAVLIASFAALAVLWRTPRLQAREEGRPVVRVPVVVDVLLGLLGVGLFALTAYAGLAGTQEPADNLAPVMVFVVVWVVVPVLSVLLGDVFSALSPWRAIGRAVSWLYGRVGGSARGPEPLAYPERLGVWPAVAVVLLFGWLELVYTDRDDPSQLALLALAYAVVQLIGITLYGVEPWSRSGDGLAVYFRLFARLSPWRRDGAELKLVRPLSRLPQLAEQPGLVALLVVAIGVTSFDGLSASSLWTSLAADLQRLFVDVGLSQTAGFQLAGTVGLLLMVAIVGSFYALGVAGMRAVDPDRSTQALRRTYVHSLVPIALAYVVAHYFSFVVLDGQSVIRLASDPLGDGADLLGTATVATNYALIGATAIWYVQVGVLVAGHVAGLLLAHDRALGLYASPRTASRSQNYMLAVMVGFTCLGLWLLSAAAT